MNKNIILCSDGTGNTALKNRGTNVFKLYEAVDSHRYKFDTSVPQQIAFYDDGVGTENFKPLKMLGGAFGLGLTRNIRQLYMALARCYQPGDKIFLFGFSRGAYTVRMLAGFILEAGILDWDKCESESELFQLTKKGYSLYRKKYRTLLGRVLRRLFNGPSDAGRFNDFRKAHAVTLPGEADTESIHFIGVWDTVDAVGLPFDGLTNFLNAFIYRFRFPDNLLSRKVGKACHAVSIDDERHTFHPVMWDELPEDKGRIDQVWFAGVHSNVGGGYDKEGLSLVTMDWMMEKAEEHGLVFISEMRSLYRDKQNVHDMLYDSRAGAALFYRIKTRDIKRFYHRPNILPKIHISVLERIFQGTDGYAPVNLPDRFSLVSQNAGSELLPAGGHSLHDFEKKINGSIRKYDSSWKSAAKWNRLRQYAHYICLACTLTLAAAAWLFRPAAAGLSGPEKVLLKALTFLFPDFDPANLRRVLSFLFEIPLWAASVLLLLVGFLLIGLYCKKGINTIGSKAWKRIMKPFRQ